MLRAGVMVGLLAAATSAAADRPLVVVVPFSGPQAKGAEFVVVKTLRKKADLVPGSVWLRAAKQLAAATRGPEDVSAVAREVGASLVVTGVVKRDGRSWQLAVSVRDGKTGHSRDKLKYPLKGPRVTSVTLSLLAIEVMTAFDHAIAAAGEPEVRTTTPPPPPPRARTEPPPPPPPRARTEPPPEPTTAPPPRTTPRNRNPPSEPPPRVAEPAPRDAEAPPLDAEPPRVVETPRERTAPAPARPLWAPYFDVTIGGSVSGRSFEFDPASQPRFNSGIAAGIRFDATIYPFAFSWRRAAGVLATLGFGLTLEKPFWVDSSPKGDSTQQFATSELSVEGGLRWRFVLYKKLPRPELTLIAGAGQHAFAIAKYPDGTDVGPSDVTYTYAIGGLQLRMHFADWASLWVGFGVLGVLSAGSVMTNTEYGSGSALGVRVHGGLDFFAWRGLKIGALAYYERFGLSFDNVNPPPAKIANSAVDQYFGGALMIGYVF